MEIKRRIHLHQRGEDLVIFLKIQIFALGMGVDQDAIEAEFSDCPPDLLCRSGGSLWRHASKTGKSVRMGLDERRQVVIELDRQFGGLPRLEHLNTRGTQAEQMHADSERIHLAKSRLEVGHS